MKNLIFMLWMLLWPVTTAGLAFVEERWFGRNLPTEGSSLWGSIGIWIGVGYLLYQH